MTGIRAILTTRLEAVGKDAEGYHAFFMFARQNGDALTIAYPRELLGDLVQGALGVFYGPAELGNNMSIAPGFRVTRATAYKIDDGGIMLELGLGSPSVIHLRLPPDIIDPMIEVLQKMKG